MASPAWPAQDVRARIWPTAWPSPPEHSTDPTTDPTTRADLINILVRGSLWGALTGAAFFATDFALTFTRWGHRLEATPESLILVSALALLPVLLGAIVGGLASGLFGDRGLRAHFWPPVGVFLALSLFFGLGKGQHQVRDGLAPDREPNVKAGRECDVLWIVIDTLRADVLYGERDKNSVSDERQARFPKAPKLGDIASRGTTFLETEAPSGWTIPSTAALLTGLSPVTLGARAGLLPAGADTIAEILRAAGWQTAAQVDNTLLDESNGFAAGFQHFSKHSPMDFGWRLLSSFLMPPSFQETFRHRLKISYSGADRLIDRALEDIEHASSAPLFLYVHAMDVHEPYWTPLADKGLAEIAEGLRALDSNARDAARKGANALSDQQKTAVRALYAAELEFVDQELGRLLQGFDEVRGLENALVIVTADHGEEFWEHGMMGHGHSLFGEVTRVPLVIHLPTALTSNTVKEVRTPVSLMDVTPTVADLLNLTVGGEPFDFEGRSLMPALRGEDFESIPLHSEQFRFNRITHRWREGDLILVDAQLPDDEHRVRLFDNSTDPSEAHDLSEVRPDDVARLEAALAEHLANLKRGDIERGSAETNAAGLKHLGYN